MMQLLCHLTNYLAFSDSRDFPSSFCTCRGAEERGKTAKEGSHEEKGDSPFPRSFEHVQSRANFTTNISSQRSPHYPKSTIPY